MDCINFEQAQNLSKRDFVKYLSINLFGGFIIAAVVLSIMSKLQGGIQKTKDQDTNESNDQFENLYSKGVKPSVLFISVIYEAFRAGLTEELFFRFFLMKYLFIDKLKLSPAVAIIVSAVIFGASHMGNVLSEPEKGINSALTQSVNAACGGLLDGYIYWKSGSIFVTMLSHFIYDVILMTLMVVSYYDFYKKKKNGENTDKKQNIRFFSPRIPMTL